MTSLMNIIQPGLQKLAAKARIIFTLTVFLATLTNTALAQAWKPGQQLLMRNNAKGAEAQLKAALKKAKTRPELAETYKYLGVAQFMTGNKNAAVASFQKAKITNPAIKLKDNEVVDESVIPFFNAVKASSTQAGTNPQAGSRGAAVSKKPSNRTILKVLSNAPNSSVRIDGIAHGSAGDEIDVDPGTVVIEVAAPGHRSARNSVRLEKNKTSVVKINLEKIQPKPKPQPKPVVQNKTPSIPLPNPVAGGNAQAVGKKSSKDSLFGDEPIMAEFNPPLPMQPSMPSVTAPQMVTPPPAPVQPVMPAMPMYQPPQMYAQPPMYQPQPMYAPPAYPAYPSYPPPSPYGGYMAPPPNPYAYAPPAPPPSVYQPYAAPPVADPYGGYLGPPPEDPMAAAQPIVEPVLPKEPSGSGMPPPPRLPSTSMSSRSAKKVKSSSDDCSAFIKILPFGAGQFCKGSAFKGLVFLGGEAAALFMYKSNSDAAASYTTKVNTILAERQAERENIDPADQEAYDEETAQKEKQGKDVIAKAKQNASLSMASFGGLYVVGVIDAFVSDPASSGKSKKGKKRRGRPRIINSYNLDLDKAPLGTYALLLPHEVSESSDINFMFGYAPTTIQNKDKLGHSLVLGLSWEL